MKCRARTSPESDFIISFWMTQISPDHQSPLFLYGFYAFPLTTLLGPLKVEDTSLLFSGSQQTTALLMGLQPVQTARSSTKSTSLDGPDVVTVTVKQTVTATTFSTVSRRPNITVTDFETVFVTRATVDELTTSIGSNGVSASSSSSSSSSTSIQSTGCNKTIPAYRLRARNALYILPSSDGPSSTAGSGC